MKKLILLFCIFSIAGFAQKRVLVSPGGDAFPIGKHQSAVDLMKRSMAKTADALVCTDKATFGYTFEQNPNPDVNHIGFHQDIMAMWYVAPASGTIDTVYWFQSDAGSLDSTVTVRLFNSNIYPGSGPGYGGYPKPGRLCWGYYVSTNDLDNGLAPFPEDATDTTWYSTVSGGIPSFNPWGDEIWGFGGFPQVVEANAVNAIDLSQLGVPTVTVGQPFAITVRIYGPHVDQATEDQTGFLAITENDTLSTHNWKFYEHIVEIQPGFTCPGWVARADFNILFWYSMTVTTNIPPTFSNVTEFENTFSTSDRVVQADILDCDPSNPSGAGVETAVIRYSLNGLPQSDLAMVNIGGDTWEVPIPGASVGDVVSYRVVATDSSAFTDSSAANTYRVVSLTTEWYTADTGVVCVDQDIRSTGTTVPNGSFFVPEYVGSGTAPTDDGTAGPFDMGATFTVFGDTFRYAWIGVNGGIALGKTPDDTIDVNANGFATQFWDFPNAQTHGRTDTAGASNMPGMFISPFWADHIVEDTAGIYGRIVYGDNSDPCLFIVEWDSIGAFDLLGSTADETTFRVVLNRCDGTVEFQYVSVGTTGLDSAALVGMQADSNDVSGPVPGWIYVNRNLYPEESKPRDSWCIRLYPNISTVALDGWNMVAVSLTPQDADYSKTALYPTAVSAAYQYGAGYTVADPLEKGKGYWVKVDGAGPIGASSATFDSSVTATVQDKWNMIGGPSGFVPTTAIIPGGTTISSSFYGYGASGYYAASTVQPGQGYWVKVSGAGTLDLTASAAAAPKESAQMPWQADPSGFNSITVRDAVGRAQTLFLAADTRLKGQTSLFDLPPVPPAGAFDVRFASQRMVEVYPSAQAAVITPEFPVTVQGFESPVTVSWNIHDPAPGERVFQIVTGSGGESSARSISGSGSLLLRGDAAARFSLRLASGALTPKQFALGRNYPNPFNPVTHFPLDLPTESGVKVSVYDLLGRTIATLVDGRLEAGSHVVEWDGRDAAGISVPTGMYIVRMHADGFSASRKVLLMK